MDFGFILTPSFLFFYENMAMMARMIGINNRYDRISCVLFHFHPPL